MIIVGLLVLAGLLTAAAFVMRPTALANGEGHRWSSGVVDLFDHVRDTGRRLTHRNGSNGHNGNGNGNGNGSSDSATTTIKEITAPPADADDQFLDGFDLRSVAQFGIRFWGALAAAGCVGFAIVWAFASVVGVVADLEHLMRDIGFEGFKFLSLEVILGVALVAAAAVAFLVTLSVIGAALYNVLARKHHGIRIFISQGAPAAENGNGSKTARRVKKSSKTVVAGDETVAAPARQAS